MPTLELPLIVPWIRLDRDAKAEEELALARARLPWLAGFCLFGGEAEQVRMLTERLRDAAGREIFVASDMERGAGQQVKGLRVLPDAAIWGLSGSPTDAYAFGAITARDARSVGVDVLFAPVLDVRSEPRNPIVGNRAFGWDPDRVAVLGGAFCRGAISGGAFPTAKHYPGHGATTSDSHGVVPVVIDSEDRLLSRDIAPFTHAIAEGCPAVMTAHVAYPSLDPSGEIATFSEPILSGLRQTADDLGVPLVVFTDALLMAGALDPAGETSASRRALLAGCDALLIPSHPERLATELFDEGGLGDEAERASERLAVFLEALGTLPAVPGIADDDLDGVPLRVADRALRMAGGASIEPEGTGGMLCVVDDDGIAERGRLLLERAKAAGIATYVARLSKDGPPPAPLPKRAKPTTIVVMSSVRAWKGESDLSTQGRTLAEQLLLASEGAAQSVWMTPRAPMPAVGIHLPGLGPDIEAALADRLFGG